MPITTEVNRGMSITFRGRVLTLWRDYTGFGGNYQEKAVSGPRKGAWDTYGVSLGIEVPGAFSLLPEHRFFDPEGPIEAKTNLYGRPVPSDPISAEEEAEYRPIFRAISASIPGWRAEDAASSKPARTFEEASRDRARNLARYGLSDSPAADTASNCEAERTPLGIPASGRRCPECGYPESHGHRMDCCFA